VNFTTYAFNVADISNLFLLKYFYSNFLLCELMNGEFDLAKSSLAESFF
jgi:hypothetical protein